MSQTEDELRAELSASRVSFCGKFLIRQTFMHDPGYMLRAGPASRRVALLPADLLTHRPKSSRMNVMATLFNRRSLRGVRGGASERAGAIAKILPTRLNADTENDSIESPPYRASAGLAASATISAADSPRLKIFTSSMRPMKAPTCCF